MTSTPEELAHLLEEYAWAQVQHLNLINRQQQSIDNLSVMMKMLFERIHKKKKSMWGKKKQTPTMFKNFEDEKDPEYVEEVSKHNEHSYSGDCSSQCVSKLKKHLNANVNQGKLQAVGIDRPYPLECDSVKYPRKVNAPVLHSFEGTNFSNQHIYYFKSHIGDVASNDPILTRLFVGTTKGEAIKWFMKLKFGSIQS